MYGYKLNLNKDMVRTHLIQRLNKPEDRSNPFAFGGGLRNGGLPDVDLELLNKLFSFDYMGSAEFEWGAVPAAISFISEQASKETPLFPEEECLISGIHRDVYYICPKQYEKGVKTLISKLLDNESELRLKQPSGLSIKVKNPQSPYYADTVGWLELDNGFFFFTDKEMFENVKNFFGVN